MTTNFFMEIADDADDAKILVDELNEIAEHHGGGCWNLGVEFDSGTDGTRVLLIGLEHEDTTEDTVLAAMKIYLSLWTLRYATEKLMAVVAKEAYLDEETLKDMIPAEMETMELNGIAPWDIPEI